MRRVFVLAVIGALQVALFAGLTYAGMLDFSDEFDAFDAERWARGDHQLGRSYLDPDSAGVGAGNLRMKLPARSLEGGEICSNALYGYRMYSARMRLPHAPSSITGFFLYEPPDYASEIDVEIHNDSWRRMAFYSTYAGGAQTHTEVKSLPFDPTDGFHEHRFEYAPDAIRFYLDGQLMKEWTDGLPTDSMKLYVNVWYPA